MTALNHFYSQQLTPQTNGSATYASILTRSGSDLLANTKYLIRARASINGADTNKTYGIRVRTDDDTSIAAKSEQIREPMSGNVVTGQPYLFVHEFTTSGTPADVIIEIAAVAGDSNAQADQISLLLDDLDDLGSANYFSTIHADPGEPNEEYPTTQADEFTIAGSSLGTDEFVVWGYQRTHVSSTNRRHRIEVLSALDASSNAVVFTNETEGEDSTDKIVTGFAVRHKASSGTPDFAVQTWKSAGQATASNGGGYAIAIKTSAFESGGIVFDYESGTIDITTSDTVVATLAGVNPTTTADHVFYGEWNLIDRNGPDCTQHIEDDGVDHRAGDEETFMRDNSDTLNDVAQTLAYGANIPDTDTSTYTLRGKARTSTTVAEHRWLIIQTTELASGAGPQTVDGVLFARPPTFIAGTIAGPLSGVLFSKPPTFIAGTVTPSNLLSGVLFTRPPSFIVGTVTPTNLLSGVLFTRSPTFIAGVVTPGGVTVTGVLFARPPSFIAGTITPTNLISGVVFARPPTFIAGTVTPTNLLSGVLFARPPSFIAGVITPGGVQLDGVLFARPPTFIAGTVTQGRTLDGVLFTRPPSFIAGTITPGGVQVDGVLFSRPPSFIAGTLSATNLISGILFARPPTFIAGTVTPTFTISGVLFTRPPSFIAGTLSATNLITGILFTRPPAFIVGTVTLASVQLDGVLFLRPPTFIAGTLSLGVQTLVGILFLRPPTFIVGLVSLQVQTPPTGLRNMGTPARTYTDDGSRSYSDD